MGNTSQREIDLLIGIPIAVFFVWFNKSAPFFGNGFEVETQKNKK